MKFAIISDIHGNLPALEAVQRDIAAEGADLVLNLGDLLAGPIAPRATADALMAAGYPTVVGNHDRYLIETEGEKLPRVDSFVSMQLSAEHLDWLRSLPKTQVIAGEVFLCHGTPSSDEAPWLDGWWTERTSTAPDEAQVTSEAEGIEFPVLLCGHTHVQRAVRLRDGRLIVNPGAVGIQFNLGAPDARYALIEKRAGGWHVIPRMVAYDHEAAANLAAANGFAHWREALTTGWERAKGLF